MKKIEKIYAVVEHSQDDNYEPKEEVVREYKTLELAELYISDQIDRSEYVYDFDNLYWTIEIQYKFVDKE